MPFIFKMKNQDLAEEVQQAELGKTPARISKTSAETEKVKAGDGEIARRHGYRARRDAQDECRSCQRNPMLPDNSDAKHCIRGGAWRHIDQ